MNYLLGLAAIAPGQLARRRTKVAFWTVVMVDIWHQVSFMIVLLLAGLSALPREPYEAARVDGAIALQSLLAHHAAADAAGDRRDAADPPDLRGASTYDLIYIMTRGGPGTSTDLVSYFIYRTAFVSLNIGEASRHVGDPADRHRLALTAYLYRYMRSLT